MTISNEALSETFIADAIFIVKVDKRPSLDEKLQYTRVAQRAITAILDGFVEGTSNSQKIILTDETRKFINEQAYADLIAPCTEWSCLVTKNVARCERCFSPRIDFLPSNANLCYGGKCILETILLKQKEQTLDQNCVICWVTKTPNNGYLCGKGTCMMKFMTLFRVTRFEETRFNWKVVVTERDDDEDIDIF